MLIYVLRDNQQTGPFTETEIRAQLATGAVTLQTLVWWQGLPQWLALAQTQIAGPPPTGVIPPHVAPPIIPAPSTYATAGMAHTSGLAVTSLTCGALGIFCAPLLGLTAVITGHVARLQIRRNPALTGSGMALAGLVLGYFWIILAVLGIFAFVTMKGAVQSSYFKLQEDSTEDTDTSPPATNAPATNAPGT